MEETGLFEQKASFMGSEKHLEGCEKVIIGLPMDATTSFRPGTRLAPYRLRQVSEGIEAYSICLGKSLEDISFCDLGDLILPFGNIIKSLDRIEKAAKSLLAKKIRIYSIGGEHLVSLPLIKAHKVFYDDLVVIQMDAHADLRTEYLGEVLSHATVMRQVAKEIGAKNLYQLGIRSATADEIDFGQRETNLYIGEFLTVLDKIKGLVGKRPVYLSVDIDVIDPAFAPGTGTPEPGGITSQEIFAALYKLKDLNIIGFDLVEISPPYDFGDITSILGAKILREALLGF